MREILSGRVQKTWSAHEVPEFRQLNPRVTFDEEVNEVQFAQTSPASPSRWALTMRRAIYGQIDKVMQTWIR